ncbi:hypothetical protein K9L67_05080 [Candidatus Woesearchaeota archaeon]|nr:hypothetical protein [Candidatus Woesearchaeota archaeon]MCF7901571.1 hypothetical protein [Candidatus Woesearchaeota archaeon]MCF8013972.1 hypothetical protein [Candidatus Woesearchaeota archaeon]
MNEEKTTKYSKEMIHLIYTQLGEIYLLHKLTYATPLKKITKLEKAETYLLNQTLKPLKTKHEELIKKGIKPTIKDIHSLDETTELLTDDIKLRNASLDSLDFNLIKEYTPEQIILSGLKGTYDDIKEELNNVVYITKKFLYDLKEDYEDTWTSPIKNNIEFLRTKSKIRQYELAIKMHNHLRPNNEPVEEIEKLMTNLEKDANNTINLNETAETLIKHSPKQLIEKGIIDTYNKLKKEIAEPSSCIVYN